MANNRKDLREIARRAMIERDLLPDFSDTAILELGRIRGAATAGEPTIRDLRELLWASIDNDDSRDLDQLTVADPLPDGSVRILVAIADVDSLVEKDSALDAHAKHNTTSVYTAGEIFPMLPDELSTDLTSLNEAQDRLAIVVEMLIAGDGRVMDSSLYRALVRNHAKLAYHGVAAWLDGSAPLPARIENLPGLQEQLRLQDNVAQTLKTRRHQQGALSLTTIEARAVFDGDILTGLDADLKNRAKELIEDFMIAANQATVTYLKRKGVPSLRRILRSPERWERIMQVAARTGDQLPSEPDPRRSRHFWSSASRWTR